MISIKKFIKLINKIITLLSRKYDKVIKKKYNFWCKLDIEEFEWFKNDIWKSNSIYFLKSKWNTIFIIIFFSNEIQNIIKSILKIIIIKRIDWNDLIVEFLMKCLLITSIIILLSKIIRIHSLAHKLY